MESLRINVPNKHTEESANFSVTIVKRVWILSYWAILLPRYRRRWYGVDCLCEDFEISMLYLFSQRSRGVPWFVLLSQIVSLSMRWVGQFECSPSWKRSPTFFIPPHKFKFLWNQGILPWFKKNSSDTFSKQPWFQGNLNFFIGEWCLTRESWRKCE